MRRRPAVFLVSVSALFLMSAACTTTPVERQANMADSVTNVKENMAATRTQVDQTLQSLDALVSGAPDNIGPAYAEYARNVDTLKARARAIEQSRAQMQQQRNAWLSAWRESHEKIQDPELQTVSEERRRQTVARFDQLSNSFEAAAQVLTPLVKNLDDVKTVVGNDLTPSGVGAVTGTAVVENAYARGAEVSRTLNEAIDRFDGLASVLDLSESR